MEPMEQNLVFFFVFELYHYKVDKIIEKSHVLNKVNGAMFVKA